MDSRASDQARAGEGAAHEGPLEVTWGDCDPAGIVFYPRYFAFFDLGAHRLFDALGLAHERVRAEHGALGLGLVDARASFKRPARPGDRCVLASRVTALGGRSVTVAHQISRDGETLVEGQEVRVWLVPGADGAIGAGPLPDAVRALLWRT